MRQSSATRLAKLGEELHAELCVAAVAGRRFGVQHAWLTGRDDTMILNGAYLVGLDEGASFCEIVRRAGQAHGDVSVEVEGPWPPYSFARLD